MKLIKKIIFILLVIALCIYAPQIYSYVMDVMDWIHLSFEGYSLEIDSEGTLVDENDIDSLEDSGITGESYTFYQSYYPHFYLLNTNQQTLYKQIYANIENVETTFVPTVKVTVNELSQTIEAVYNDHPECFWVNTAYSYKYTTDGYCVQVILDYYVTADQLAEYQSSFENSAYEIIQAANQLSTDAEKEKYVHDKIIDLVTYNSQASMNQSAYSALVNHQTVCAGYARAFQYIMIQLGIPTYYVTGTASGEDHAWNIVKLSDGYYNVDLTWDDQSQIIYDYFNVADTTFQTTHTRTGLSTLLPTCEGTLYTSQTEENNDESSSEDYYEEKNKQVEDYLTQPNDREEENISTDDYE